jgi:hypothetical protein
MRLVDEAQIVSGFVPVDLQTAANVGDAVSLRNYGHLTVVFFKGIGTDGDDPDVKIEQCTDVAGTGHKKLAVDRYWYKSGVDLAAVGEFTEVTSVTQDADGVVDLGTEEAELQGVYVFEIDAGSLDVSDGFDCVRVTVPDVGSHAQLGCLLYLLSKPRHATAVMPSAISD